MPGEMGWMRGADGERGNGNESGLVEGARSEEQRKAAVEMGRLGEERYL